MPILLGSEYILNQIKSNYVRDVKKATILTRDDTLSVNNIVINRQKPVFSTQLSAIDNMARSIAIYAVFLSYFGQNADSAFLKISENDFLIKKLTKADSETKNIFSRVYNIDFNVDAINFFSWKNDLKTFDKINAEFVFMSNADIDELKLRMTKAKVVFDIEYYRYLSLGCEIKLKGYSSFKEFRQILLNNNLDIKNENGKTYLIFVS